MESETLHNNWRDGEATQHRGRSGKSGEDEKGRGDCSSLRGFYPCSKEGNENDSDDLRFQWRFLLCDGDEDEEMEMERMEQLDRLIFTPERGKRNGLQSLLNSLEREMKNWRPRSKEVLK
ncbi:hypothetical protein AAC387_Pa01g3549 [Persea americana]